MCLRILYTYYISREMHKLMGMRGIVLLMVVAWIGAYSLEAQDSKYSFVDQDISKPQRFLKTSYSKIPVYDFDGLEALLRGKAGKTFVINFWATWCKPCVKEIPAFEKLQKRYFDKGVEVILVSLDFPNKVRHKLLPFVEQHALKSQVLLLDDPDQNNWIPKVDTNWSGAIPATLIFNTNRREFYEKSFTFIGLEAEIQHFLD